VTRPLVVLVTGDPVGGVAARRGPFSALFAGALDGVAPAPLLPVEARGSELAIPDDVAGVIVTGSASSVTERAPWMLRTEALLRDLVRREVPVLGVCFGHQLLGAALGGRVERNPRGREIGTVDVEVLVQDPLLEGLPGRFAANATHMDSVTVLPPGATLLARSALEPHAAVRFGAAAWGVQFHPEFDRDVMRGYLEARAELVRAEGGDPARLLAAAGDGEGGRALLRTFARMLSTR